MRHRDPRLLRRRGQGESAARGPGPGWSEEHRVGELLGAGVVGPPDGGRRTGASGSRASGSRASAGSCSKARPGWWCTWPGPGEPGRPMGRAPRVSAILHCAVLATTHGRLPEWPKGAVCKTVGLAYVGSNPTPATNYSP